MNMQQQSNISATVNWPHLLSEYFDLVSIHNQVLVIVADFTIKPSMSGVIFEEIGL